jgi:hypothetical protein
VVKYSYEMSAWLAMLRAIFGYILYWRGCLVGVVLFAMYLHQLVVDEMSEGHLVPTMKLLVGDTRMCFSCLLL